MPRRSNLSTQAPKRAPRRGLLLPGRRVPGRVLRPEPGAAGRDAGATGPRHGLRALLRWLQLNYLTI